MTRRLLLPLLLIISMSGPGLADAQELDDLPDPAGFTFPTMAFMQIGKERMGVCGDGGAYSPHGKGLGFLQFDKAWYWRIAGGSGFDFCGRADVPPVGVPEVGTAGACDALRGSGGIGFVRLVEFGAPVWPALLVDQVGWPATGSVMVVTGRVHRGDGSVGSLVGLFQRHTSGMCVHKDRDLPTVGSRYPWGGRTADLVGAIAVAWPS